jgi:hypothetical protein
MLLAEALSYRQTKTLKDRFGCVITPILGQPSVCSWNADSRRKQDDKEPPAKMVVGEAQVTFTGVGSFPFRVVATDHFFLQVNDARRYERITPREVWELVETMCDAMLKDFFRKHGRIFSLSVRERICEALNRRHDFNCIVQNRTTRLNVVGVIRWDEIRQDGLAFVLCTAMRKPIEKFFSLDPSDHIYCAPSRWAN